MTTLTTEPAADAAFERLARDLARGAEVESDRVLVTVAAAGRTMADLQAACDRFAAEIPEMLEPELPDAITGD